MVLDLCGDASHNLKHWNATTMKVKDLHSSERTRRSFAELWNLILSVASYARDDLIQSLRVLLFAELSRRQERGLHGNARHLAASLWSFRSGGRPNPIPKVQRKLPLLLLPYSSGSHMLNMLPVVREARRRGLLGGIIGGSVMAGNLNQFDGLVTERELLGLAGGKLLPQIIQDVWRSFKRLIELFDDVDPNYALR